MTVGQTNAAPCALDTLIIGQSPETRRLREMIRRVARSNASVLLCGPSGSGKELVARAIHDEGVRSGKAFSAINCGAIPGELIESELFGHEKGSFTGAHARRIGHFEASDGGTLFLDEIGDMRFDMQVKLLRVLEERTIVRVGSSEVRPVDIRLISATHQNLGAAIADGKTTPEAIDAGFNATPKAWYRAFIADVQGALDSLNALNDVANEKFADVAPNFSKVQEALEEVLRESQMSAPTRVRRFLSRFMVVVVVALSIETLVVVFQVTHEDLTQLQHAAVIGIAAAALLAAWGLFVQLNKSAETLEPEAMEQAKREDEKVEAGDADAL